MCANEDFTASTCCYAGAGLTDWNVASVYGLLATLIVSHALLGTYSSFYNVTSSCTALAILPQAFSTLVTKTSW